MPATIDDVYAQNQTIISAIGTLQTDVDAIKSSLASAQSSINTLDDKIDILSGDTTATNVLDKVLNIEKKVKAMEFKMKR